MTPSERQPEGNEGMEAGMRDEHAILSRAVMALGDKIAKSDPWTAFFSVACRRAIEGKSPEDAMALLNEFVTDAQFAKLRGEGPPLDEIRAVHRLYNQIHETWVAERLPSKSRKEVA